MPSPTRPTPPMTALEQMLHATAGLDWSPRPPRRRRKPALPPGLGLAADPVTGPAVAYAAEQLRDWTRVKGWAELHDGLTSLAIHRDELVVAIAAAEKRRSHTRTQEAKLADQRMQLRIAYAKMEALCWVLAEDDLADIG